MHKSLLLLCICLTTLFAACEKEVIVEKIITIRDTIRINEIDRPINLKASKGNFGNRIIVSWSPMPLAKMFELYRFDDVSQQYKLAKETADTIFTDLDIPKPLKQVYYKIRVKNSDLEYSRFSDIDYGYTSGLNFSISQIFGSEGTGAGELKFAMHLEVDDAGNIYVSDEGNNMVHKFDKTGKFIEVFFYGSGARGIAFLNNGHSVVTRTQSSSYIKIIDGQKNVIREWGTYGTGDSQFGNIDEITVDDEQNIYVVDGINNMIKKFDTQGNFLLKFPGATQVSGQNDKAYPFGICFFKNNIYVSSPRNSMIRVYDKTGKFLRSWDAGSRTFAIKARNEHLYLACVGYIVKTDEMGLVKEEIGRGKLAMDLPALAVTKDEDIIVSDIYARKIITFKRL